MLSFRVERSGIEESTHDMPAKQHISTKILRLAALAQDDSVSVLNDFMSQELSFLLCKNYTIAAVMMAIL